MNMLGLIPGGLINFFAFIVIFLPIAMYFFRDKRLNLIELGFISLILSITLVPLFVWIMNIFIPFSISLAITLLLFIVVSSYLILTKSIVLEPYHTQFSKSSIIVMFLCIVAFVLRMQSLSSYFYEFDPYYYAFVPEYLITQGYVPMSDNWAYASTETIAHGGQVYTLHPVGHRNLPLPQYLTAVWYYLSFGPDNFNHLVNKYVADVYPPLLGALIVFLGYMLFKEEYGNPIAVSGAFMLAFVPVLFTKFLAGVSEQLPWGLYAGFAGVVMLYLALIHQDDRKYYLLAVIGVLGALLGSKAGMIPIVIFAMYAVARSMFEFLHNERHRIYYELSFVLMLTTVVSGIFSSIYFNSDLISEVLSSNTLLLLMAALFSFFIYHLLDFGKDYLDTMRKRAYALCGIGLVSAIFLISPLGTPILSYGLGLAGVGQLSAENALQKTVAEENLYSADLQERFGYMGISIDISRISSLFIGKYGTLYALPFVYVLMFFSLVYALVKRKSHLVLLLAIFIYSLSFIGLQKIKYTPHLALVLSLSVVIVAGEAVLSFADKETRKYLAYIPGILLLVIVSFAALLYLLGIITYFVQGGGISYFALSDTVYYIMFGVILCALLYYIYLNYKESRYDMVFGILVVLLVLPFALNNVEVVPYSLAYLTVDGTNYSQVSAFCDSTKDTFYAKMLYCTVIPQYWYDSMEWIRNNVDDDSYVISWWDYGHWTNFFGRKRTVTRNDHPFVILDLEVADKFVNGTPQELKNYMNIRNSTYVLFDADLIGKWGALTYLSCVYNGDTKPTELPQESKCSASYQFEHMYVPVKTSSINEICVINESSYGKVGVTSFGRVYCVLDQQGSYPLVFDYNTKAQVRVATAYMGSRRFDDRNYNEYLMIYLDPREAPGNGYNSVYYKAFFLGELEGFEQVYPADKVGPGLLPIRIYKKLT
ncbi:MAG: hypothetical protein ACP5H8_03890 [Candidatus Micrarchaeia archaeon]